MALQREQRVAVIAVRLGKAGGELGGMGEARRRFLVLTSIVKHRAAIAPIAHRCCVECQRAIVALHGVIEPSESDQRVSASPI
jgi:hypothetical protein